MLKNIFGVRRQAQRDAALDSQIPNAKKSKAPPLSAHSKFRPLSFREDFFSSLLGCEPQLITFVSTGAVATG